MGFQWINQTVLRQDAPDKSTGETKFMSDLSFPGMLWGGVLRSGHPHALIKQINCDAARIIPGVVAVLTHMDIKGLNAYGIAIQDQPVLCFDKVRYQGDAVALVAAESRKLVKAALAAIEIEYQPLPLVVDPVAGANNEPSLVHAGGNVLLHTQVVNGDVEEAFRQADIVIENTYRTSRQMPGYLETEGGVAVPDENGGVTVWCGSHHPHRDRKQIARVMDYPPEKIRVISHPVGGGFGGKDEITIQIHLVLLAMKTGRPVKIVLSREESIIAGWKRHPMIIAMKTAATKDGLLTANQVTIHADSGAYASLGAAILNVAIENSSGSYRVPNVNKNGYCVYTNNGVAGAMRGFGDNQATFAIETQMDLIARELGLDPLEIRLKNGLLQGDRAAIGHTLTQSIGTIPTLKAVGQSRDWVERERWKKDNPKPWIKRGVGLATALKGVGLGRGITDVGRATIEIQADGCFTVAVGCPDLGQGNTVAFSQMAAEALSVDIKRIKIINGDTAQCPDSGSSTASRSIYAGGNAIVDAAGKMLDLLKNQASQILVMDIDELTCRNEAVVSGVPSGSCCAYSELAGELIKAESNIVHGLFVVPVADHGIDGAPGLPHLVYSAMSNLAMVEVNTLTGECRVVKILSIPDAGRVINTQGLEGQAEGGALMGMGYALTEDVVIAEGKVITTDLSTYIMPTSLDAPLIEVLPVEELEPSGPFGAKGIGEVATVAVTPAITNAILDATGVAVTSLPVTPEKLLKALRQNGVECQNGGPSYASL